MKVSLRAAVPALVLSCLAIAPATAAPIDYARDPLTVHVSYRDLDLHTAAGRDTLVARIRRAANRACEPRGRSLDMLMDAQRCKSEMRDNAETQIAALVRNDGVRLAALPR